MKRDVLDLKDMIFEAEAEVQEIIREVGAELQLPKAINALHMRWMTLPDELKERTRKEQPEAYAQIMETIGHDTNDDTTYKSARPAMDEHGGNNATY